MHVYGGPTTGSPLTVTGWRIQEGWTQDAWLMAFLLPPIALVILTMCMMSTKQDVFLQLLQFMVPDLERAQDKEVDGILMFEYTHHRFEHDTASDSDDSELDGLIKTSRTFSDYSTRLESERNLVAVQTSHFRRILIMPLMLAYYLFWDQVVIRRYTTDSFPAHHCQSDFHCYFSSSGKWWRQYHNLGCADMKEQTLSSASGYFFAAPEDANYYVCYALVITVRDIIGAIGDFVSVLGICVMPLLYIMTMFGDGEDRERRKRNVWVAVEVGFALTFCALTFVAVSHQGTFFNETAGMIAGPVLAAFGFFVADARREGLSKMLST